MTQKPVKGSRDKCRGPRAADTLLERMSCESSLEAVLSLCPLEENVAVDFRYTCDGFTHCTVAVQCTEVFEGYYFQCKEDPKVLCAPTDVACAGVRSVFPGCAF